MEAHALTDLVRGALLRRRRWYLVLRFRATADEERDWSQISQALPWLRELGRQRNALCEDLRRHGLGIVVCNGEAEARRLISEVRGSRLPNEVYDPLGCQVFWARRRTRAQRPEAAAGEADNAAAG